MWITEFRMKDEQIFKYVQEAPINNNYGNEMAAYLLNILSDYSLKNNKKLEIARSSLRPEKKAKISAEDEKLFLEKNCDYYFLEELNSYELAESARVIVTIHSNLGPELLSRDHRVLFVNLSSFIYKKWYFLDKYSDLIYTESLDKKEIY